jgi:hypothetical protein
MNRHKKESFVISLFLLICVPLSFSQNGEKRAPVDGITVNELRQHIYFLASDYLAGRKTTTPGFQIAAEYAASQFQSADLKPVLKDENGKPTFFQRVPLIHKVLDPRSALWLRSTKGEFSWGHKDHCLVAFVQDPEDTPIPSGAPAFVGFGISEPAVGWDDYSDLQVQGKIVLCLSGVPRINGRSVLPKELDAIYGDLGKGLSRKLMEAKKRKAGAVVFLLDPATAQAWGIIQNAPEFRQDVLHYPGREPYFPENARPIIPVLLVHPDVVRRVFEGENYDPFSFLETGQKENYRRFELKKATVGLNLSYKRMPVNCKNVVAMVEGTDSQWAHQVITVGAHLDHLGTQAGEVYNGADDNASGSAALLEIAESVAVSPPRRPVLFILYTGEEDGSYGSRFFTENCPVPIKDVMVNINLDMLGRKSDIKNTNAMIEAFGPAQAFPQLRNVLVDVNNRTEKIPLFLDHDPKDVKRFFYTGDHQCWYECGIPFVHFCDFGTRDVHKPTDDADKIDFSQVRSVSRLVYHLVMELGNRNVPLVPQGNALAEIGKKEFPDEATFLSLLKASASDRFRVRTGSPADRSLRNR